MPDDSKLSDHRFTPLVESDRPVIENLLAKYTREEMLHIVKTMPPDKKALVAVWPGPIFKTEKYMQEYAKIGALATYTAAVLRHGTAKLLNEILKLRQQELKLIQDATALMQQADIKQASAVQATLQRYGKSDEDQVHPQEVQERASGDREPGGSVPE